MIDGVRNGRPLLFCAALDAEVRVVFGGGLETSRLESVPSGLCNVPKSLARAIRHGLTSLGHDAVLGFGCCHPGIDAQARCFHATRLIASNCFSMLLGEVEYARGMAAGSFFVLPEWAPRWRSIFEETLGLAPDVAAGVLQSTAREIVYLDTGVSEYPAQCLADLAAYCGLPVARRPVGLEHLRGLLAAALGRYVGPERETAKVMGR